MRRGTLRTSAWTLAAFGIAVALSACGSSEDPNSIGGGGNGTNDPTAPGQTAEPSAQEQIQQLLDQRKTDYGEALRTASLKLRDRLPDFAEIKQIEAAGDANAKKAVYEKLVDDMIASQDFSRTMVKFWKDTYRTAHVGAMPAQGMQYPNNVNRDSAANFSAQVVVEGRNYTQLFTATAGTCPTFDATTATFTATDCPTAVLSNNNNTPVPGQASPAVGILNDPGLMSQYFANMAFRRVRFIQETFVCSKFPAEYAKEPKPMGNGVYTGTFDFNTITGKQNTPTARVDFQDTQAVICANCHANLNRLAPLFLNFGETGALSTQVEVRVPIPNEPRATRADYLPEGESLAWRQGKAITDLTGLGAAMAADPDVATCAVNRVWNYAMSRGDIVNDVATVPKSVTDPYVTQFVSGGMNLKETIRQVFKSEDFTKF